MDELIEYVSQNIPEKYKNLSVYKIPIVVKGKLVWYKYNRGNVELDNAPAGLKPLLIYNPDGDESQTEKEPLPNKFEGSDENLDPRQKRLKEREERQRVKNSRKDNAKAEKATEERPKRERPKRERPERAERPKRERPDRRKKDEEIAESEENVVLEPMTDEVDSVEDSEPLIPDDMDERPKRRPDRPKKERPERPKKEEVDPSDFKFKRKPQRVIFGVIFLLCGIGWVLLGLAGSVFNSVFESMGLGSFGSIFSGAGMVYLICGIILIVLQIIIFISRSGMCKAADNEDVETYKSKKSVGTIMILLTWIVIVGSGIVASKVAGSAVNDINQQIESGELDNLEYNSETGTFEYQYDGGESTTFGN
ncbi:MAG: hypothetical protein IIT65_12725 [Lachnospiraceae bacterium]|nr:hypothetical protein [Lachnospiraceae bacterium]